jgi:2-oxoacid:acceptor oxidoreductase delta subunit (pyruvate/2-ketoisovalerate family)
MTEYSNENPKRDWMKINLPRGKREEVQSYKGFDDLPPIPISFPSKGAIGKTGSWRTFRPVLKHENCKDCKSCYLYCPEGTVLYHGPKNYEIDYDYCKGCGICAKECKFGAIVMVLEEECDNDH